MALHTYYIDWEEKTNWKLEKEEKDSFNQRRIGLDFFFSFFFSLFFSFNFYSSYSFSTYCTVHTISYGGLCGLTTYVCTLRYKIR